MASTIFQLYYDAVSLVKEVSGPGLETRTPDPKVVGSIPVMNGVNHCDLHKPHFGMSTGYVSRKQSSSGIDLSCKNLFRNRCKMNTFKL